MRSSHRRPIVAGLAVVLGLCLIVLVFGYLAGSSPSAGRPTATIPPTVAPVVTTKSIGTEARCYFEQNHIPPIPLQQARDTIKPLLPTDARYIRTYSPAEVPELTVDLYSSAWLAGRYKPETFIGGDPGQFIVVHAVYSGNVPRTAIACGNKP